MNSRSIGICCLAWICLAVPQQVVADDLPAAIKRVLRVHKIPAEAVSLVVQATDEEHPRLTLNSDVARNPASTIKLVTTWTALDMLGPTHTWRTDVFALGPVKNGTLKGDLLIRGGGDPYFLLEDFWKLLGEVRAAGIQHIEGDLLLDDSLFEVDEHDPGEFDGDRFRLYNVLPAAMMVNFKAIKFMINPHPDGKHMLVTTVPELSNLTITNRIKAVAGPCKGKAPQIVMDTASADDPDHVVFSGKMPRSCRNYSLERTAMTANSYAFGVFKTLWGHWGGTIDGGHRHATLTQKTRPLVTWRSRHLGEVIRPLNKWSNNLMTRMLLYSISEAQHPAPATRAKGSQALREHLKSRGLDVSQLLLDNGSGLSRDTRVTARFMTDLLRQAWYRPSMPEFVASLAIAGKDGTVRKRFRGKKQSGSMHLKTGSLDNVSAISGYVHTEKKRTFVVALLINGRGVNYGIGKNVQDALLAWTYAQE
jgi:serine-type D-Ala-D-Ala carboxypeptidase/endopeptidase (penicillin-binding protein 4)